MIFCAGKQVPRKRPEIYWYRGIIDVKTKIDEINLREGKSYVEL